MFGKLTWDHSRVTKAYFHGRRWTARAQSVGHRSQLMRLLPAHTLAVGTSLHAIQATKPPAVAPASRAWLAGNTHI